MRLVLFWISCREMMCCIFARDGIYLSPVFFFFSFFFLFFFFSLAVQLHPKFERPLKLSTVCRPRSKLQKSVTVTVTAQYSIL